MPTSLNSKKVSFGFIHVSIIGMCVAILLHSSFGRLEGVICQYVRARGGGVLDYSPSEGVVC
jgi:hypothetical protein